VAILSDLSELLFSFQKDHSPSVKARLNLIDTLHAKVMVHYSAKQEPSQSEPDFDKHLKHLQVTLEEFSGRWKAFTPLNDSERHSYFMEVAKRAVAPFEGQFPIKGASVWETIKLMADLEYHPTLAQLSMLLYTLWFYWDGFRDHTDDPNDDFEAALDLNLAKLAYHVGVETSSVRQWGRRELTRTKKSTATHKKKREREAKSIKQIFFKLNFPPKTKIHRVAIMIQTELHPKPSLDTIKDILRFDPETKLFFTQNGRFWIYESVTSS
jgi:hypothetical protein